MFYVFYFTRKIPKYRIYLQFLEFLALNEKYQDKTFEVIFENYRRMN